MLSIGEFSNLCRVSAKTLRYYAEIGLLAPSLVNPESGYRYYAMEQLETMLFINRMKAYSFSLEEIRELLKARDAGDGALYPALLQKKEQLEKRVRACQSVLEQLDGDMQALAQGKAIMAYMEKIRVQLADVPAMRLLSVRKRVRTEEYPTEYAGCFGRLFRKIAAEKLTMAAPPMVLFHSAEHTPAGLDTEFAVPVREYVTGTRDFCPGLCLKTVVRGAYTQLPSVYTKQLEWAEKEGYKCVGALYEVYVTDPTQAADEKDNVTEVYCPVKKAARKG
ncbi:MerR family transcriptional regulator [Allofournierella sp.]|uniref:MerR family transcriptional regulator n=1 Tax=Allofournierella sp. TaxID=1940256 RepID=UPI003AB803BF